MGRISNASNAIKQNKYFKHFNIGGLGFAGGIAFDAGLRSLDNQRSFIGNIPFSVFDFYAFDQLYKNIGTPAQRGVTSFTIKKSEQFAASVAGKTFANNTLKSSLQRNFVNMTPKFLGASKFLGKSLGVISGFGTTLLALQAVYSAGTATVDFVNAANRRGADIVTRRNKFADTRINYTLRQMALSQLNDSKMGPRYTILGNEGQFVH